jgi:hypothetical protein
MEKIRLIIYTIDKINKVFFSVLYLKLKYVVRDIIIVVFYQGRSDR